MSSNKRNNSKSGKKPEPTVDDRDSAILQLPTLWKTVWTSISSKHTVTLNEYGYLTIKGYPTIDGHSEKNFWSMSTGKANARGWNWWGDTDVYVTEITGPKTFEEACEVAIITGRKKMNVSEATDEGQFANWKEFWDKGLRNLTHDLPNWPGAPLRAVWLRPFDGNDSCIIAQKDASTFYVVNLGTS